jgi:hypothetical protein
MSICAQFSNCPDENKITIISECGTVLDLCLDNYVLEPGQQMIVMDVFSNDIELFDACASKIITNIGPDVGTVVRIRDFPDNGLELYGTTFDKPTEYDECLHVYIAATPDGVIFDQYEYETKVSDNCINYPDYCESGAAVGKIWTIYARYIGAKDVKKVEVYENKGQTSTIFTTYNKNLSTGDYFFIDGTSLPNNQTEWGYKFYFADNSAEVVDVHTSCSAPIFGLPHPAINNGSNWVTDPNRTPLLLPISGCISPGNGGQTPGPSEACSTVAPNEDFGRQGIKTREEVSTQSSDITTVTIIRNTILPLRLSEFSVYSKPGANVIQWTIESAKDEFEMILEKSNDGVNFYPKKSFVNIALETYTFYDNDIAKKDHYYRIKSISVNGINTYSTVKYIEREVESTITIHPNPTKGLLELSIYSNQLDIISSINIFDMAGRRLYHQNIGQTSKQLDLKSLGLTSGIYILEASSENGLSKIDRIIIQ